MTRPLRILFYASCLEPGWDGVGDYTRQLAEACARQGHRCAVVALHDSYVEHPEYAGEDGDAIVSQRLPADLDWPERIKSALAFRERFQPDWISLQLVPYAFHKRGILFGLIPMLRALTLGVPLHVMFHELYLAAGRPAPFRHHLIGGLQAAAIRRLLATIHPQLVTTSNPVYATMLRSLGTQADVLPLFGNIPVLEPDRLPAIDQLLPGSGVTAGNRADWWVGLFFGAMHEQWEPEPFFATLIRAAKRAGKKIHLVLAGRSGRATWTKLQRDYARQITFTDLGEKNPAALSALLQSADFGVACSPWQLIGKSGTVAAMLDHGLPVIVTRDDFQPSLPSAEPPTKDALVHRFDDQLEARLVAGLARRAPRARVEEVAAQLCANLDRLIPAQP